MSNTDGDQDGQKSACVFLTLKATGENLYTKGHYKKAIDNFTEVSLYANIVSLAHASPFS